MSVTMAPEDLTAYARHIAPHIDRLAVAVHRYARPATRELLREFGLHGGAGVLVDLRAALLAEPVTLADAAFIDRYAPRETLAAGLEEHVRQGLLRRDDALRPPAYACTTRGRDLLLRLTELQGETIDVLWAVHAAALPPVAALATDVTDYAAATLPLDGYPSFRLQHAAPVPFGATAGRLLLTRLTALRYLRADAHAQALAAHALDAARGHALTVLWRSGEARAEQEVGEPWYDAAAIEPALRTLRERGLVEQGDGGWRMSAGGRALREAIEEATDRYAAPAFSVLDRSDQTRFLGGVERLPS